MTAVRAAARAAAPVRSPGAGDPDRHLRVVAPAAAPGRRGLRIAGGLAVVFAVLFLNVVLHTFLVSGQADLNDLDDAVRDAKARNQTLRLEVAQLSSPERIVADAEGQGLIRPDQVTWVTAGPSGPTSTTASQAPTNPLVGDEVAAGDMADDTARSADESAAAPTAGR